jgi:hypothetical protein
MIKRMKQNVKDTNHLFLWPQNALGSPVRMRRVPRTPKAGSSLVASTIGAGEGVDVLEVVADAEDVGVGVSVTLNVVGTTVVIGTFWPWDWTEVVNVTELVVSTKDTVCVLCVEEDCREDCREDCKEDWADTGDQDWAARRARRRFPTENMVEKEKNINSKSN